MFCVYLTGTKTLAEMFLIRTSPEPFQGSDCTWQDAGLSFLRSVPTQVRDMQGNHSIQSQENIFW